MIEALEPRAPRTLASAWTTSDWVLGLFAASVVPAIFWLAVLSGAGATFGFSVSLSQLVVTGLGITMFLGTIFTTITYQRLP